MKLDPIWSDRYPLSSRRSVAAKNKCALDVSINSLQGNPISMRIIIFRANLTSSFTYLTSFQQEQLEHWVQIGEVQASTGKNIKGIVSGIDKWNFIKATSENSFLLNEIDSNYQTSTIETTNSCKYKRKV